MANAALAAPADEHVFAELRDLPEWDLEPSWHGPRQSVAELSDDDMWAVVEGDPDESEDEDWDDDDDDDDDDWDWDDDDDNDYDDDDDGWN